jgi:NAD(P)-dependent dehydrogenase (short-subunit alcohol dehydrogenase family)
MNISFENKVALVTGAGFGLGLATAKAFAESGASVGLADWNEQAVRSAAEELAAQGHKALAIRCDVADDDQVEAIVEQTAGLIHTPMADQMMAAGQADALNAMLKDVPIGRLGRPDEIADAVLWLCSPAASLVVGHALAVDGGFTVH